MKIIEPKIEHFESVCEIYSLSIRDAFEKEGLGDLEETISEEINHKKESLLNYLKGDIYNRKYLIAVNGDDIVGTISFGPCGKQIKDCTDENFPTQIELGGLYIKPYFQNQGIGSSLINKMIKEMKNMGIHIFSCDSGYKRAQKRWIRKFGEPYLVAKDYWGEDGDHMIWLCKSDDFI